MLGEGRIGPSSQASLGHRGPSVDTERAHKRARRQGMVERVGWGGVLMCVLAFGGSTAFAAAEDGLSAKAIVDKAAGQNQIGLDSGQAVMEMQIHTRQGQILTRKLLIRASAKSGQARLRMTFQEPQDQRGIEVLMLEQAQGGDLQYLYLPSFKKVRRISGSAKNGRFEGSDFTYADMENRNLQNGTYERAPDEKYMKQDVFRVDVTPKPGAGESYSKVSMWISKKAWLPLKVLFHDLQGQRQKELRVKRIKKVNGRYMVTRAVMKNLLKGGETLLSIHHIQSDMTFSDSVFTPGALGK